MKKILALVLALAMSLTGASALAAEKVTVRFGNTAGAYLPAHLRGKARNGFMRIKPQRFRLFGFRCASCGKSTGTPGEAQSEFAP